MNPPSADLLTKMSFPRLVQATYTFPEESRPADGVGGIPKGVTGATAPGRLFTRVGERICWGAPKAPRVANFVTNRSVDPERGLKLT